MRDWTPEAETPIAEPLILFATHGSWWDAALSIVLSLRTFRFTAYGMMEHKQLSAYRFFRRIGMFSVVREDPRSALASLHYAASVLRGTGNVLWMFPQGTLVNQEQRPLGCQPGLGILSGMLDPVWLCPVGFRYELLYEQHPSAHILVGKPFRIEGGFSTPAQVNALAEERLTAVADELRAASLESAFNDLEPLFRGRRSMEKQFDKVRGR